MTMLTDSDLRELRLCEVFCNCGTPDPINDGHATTCPIVAIPWDILEEVDELAPGRTT